MGPVDSVKIQLAVVLGKSILPINQLLRMGRGAVIELDSSEEDDVEILANNVPIARGEVAIHNDRIAVTVREMLKSTKRRSTVAPPANGDHLDDAEMIEIDVEAEADTGAQAGIEAAADGTDTEIEAVAGPGAEGGDGADAAEVADGAGEAPDDTEEEPADS